MVQSPQQQLQLLMNLSIPKYEITDLDARKLITTITGYFRYQLIQAGYQERPDQAIITKFRDAGRRSAPWKPVSGRVPGRPQDGADGNRRSRWLFESGHKFYATEIMATLVEVKYYLQTLSMEGAPPLPPNSIQNSFDWLLGHEVMPGKYFDPIQLIPMKLDDFINDPRSIQSGHYIPLDRGGRHVPDNTFLMLYRSNQIQGNLTVAELIYLMGEIVKRHNIKESSVISPIPDQVLPQLPLESL